MASATPIAEQPFTATPLRRWLVVAALSFASIVSYVDRQIINLLVEPIKDLLSGQARRAEGLGAIWTKVKLFCTVYDPSTGGYRANYSLFVEIFAGLSIAGAVIGFLVSQRRRRPRPA